MTQIWRALSDIGRFSQENPHLNQWVLREIDGTFFAFVG